MHLLPETKHSWRWGSRLARRHIPSFAFPMIRELDTDPVSTLSGRRRLTPAFVRATTKPVEVYDTVVPQLIFKVTPHGHKAWNYAGTFPGHKNPTRRSLGPVFDGTRRSTRLIDAGALRCGPLDGELLFVRETQLRF